jgi:peptidyl-dipeptidase Dcp
MSRRPALLVILAIALTLPAGAQQPAGTTPQANPLLQEWTTPFGVPPFADIKPEHILPAVKEAVAQQRREVEAIASRSEPPTFANTIEALEHTGDLVQKVTAVFSNLVSADTNDQLQAINRQTTPLLSALRDDIRLNAPLFARVKAVWDQREKLSLTPVQAKLLENTYKSFVRSGANLTAEQKDRLRKVNAEMSMLGLKFGDNLLHDTNTWRLVIENQADLKGLPPSVVSAGADMAKGLGLPGAWVYTLQAPSIWPFMQYADSRELRRQIFTAYITRNDHNDQYDNKAVLARTAALRAERAQLLGYKTHADFVLEENMAKAPAAVYALLNQIWTPARAVTMKEAAAQQEMIRQEGATFALEPWDWWYYTEKVRKARFNLDEQALRPYFKIENVREGMFYVANRLYGITFTPRPDLPVYNPEVQAFEVKDRDGTHLGVYYTDYHPRPGKRVGAWSSSFRGTRLKDGQRVTPVTVNVCNFSRPAGDQPALLSLEEVQTLFHESGHALNGLLSRVPYRSLAAGPRDFTELQSQIMENWALEPDVLKVYAKHYKTGEIIPLDLVDRIKKSEQFNQGFITLEYLAASFLDMDWHTLIATTEQNVPAFEEASMERIKLPKEVVSRYRSPYFTHIFGPGGGYASGYYGYIWADVLVADAYEAFKEKGIFDQATARSFRTNILEKGGTEEAMTLYKRFRGREPSVEPLLVKRGLK